MSYQNPYPPAPEYILHSAPPIQYAPLAPSNVYLAPPIQYAPLAPSNVSPTTVQYSPTSVPPSYTPDIRGVEYYPLPRPPRSGWYYFWMVVYIIIIVAAIAGIAVAIWGGCTRCGTQPSGAQYGFVQNTGYVQAGVQQQEAQLIGAPLIQLPDVLQVMPTLANRVIPTPENYIAIDSNPPVNDVPGTIKDISLQACLDRCSSDNECKGAWYDNNKCLLLNIIPEVKGESDQTSLYLKQHYDPKIIDKVFIGNSNAKLIGKEWWTIKDHDLSGNITVFSANNSKSWFLSSGKFDIINSGRLIGIFSSSELSATQTKDLLDKDIQPTGVVCVVDIPDKDIYQLDLSVFGKKTIYVQYLNQ
jgi:hypothetical protein